MVKIAAVLFVVLLCAVPLMAQDDYPRIQTSLGYANLSLTDFGSVDFTTGFLTGATAHHSGFANETSFNFTRSLGVNNYMGIYGLGNNTTMIADFIGGRAMYRTARVVPYGLAGIGFAYLTSSTSYYGSSSFATRYGGGVDVPFNDTMAFKFEVSRMSFHFGQLTPTGGSWTSGTNFQTGVVFTLAQ
jgi:hypothetical protein